LIAANRRLKAVCIHPELQIGFSLLVLRDFCPKTGSHFSEIASMLGLFANHSGVTAPFVCHRTCKGVGQGCQCL
jgi:hypothetical protein